jgi:predicted RNA binding protein YcfA (HicA-like mRNA interferase family)
MKLRDFLQHLARHNCHVRREGGNHTIYTNAINGKSAAVPRHGEVKAGTLKRICRDLDIPAPDR